MNQEEFENLLESGADLSTTDAKGLECRTAEADWRARTQLLGFYMAQKDESAFLRYWEDLVRMYPTQEALALPVQFDDHTQKKMSSVWLELANDMHDVRVTLNAFRFVGTRSFSEGVELLKHGPVDDSREWTLAQASFYLRHGRELLDARLLARSSELYLRALDTSASEMERNSVLHMVAISSLAAGNLETARGIANECVGTLGFNAGALHHVGHVVLGLLVALINDWKRAAEHLRLSANEADTFFIASFGPRWELAAVLWERGYQAAVSDYVRALGGAHPRNAVGFEETVSQKNPFGEGPLWLGRLLSLVPR